MGSLRLPQQAVDWFPETTPDYVKQRIAIGTVASEAGLPLNFDSWDGYPAARERALKAAQDADADLIVLSGDSHNGWAFDLPADGKPAGVEFAGHSVTSPGFESYFQGLVRIRSPRRYAKQTLRSNGPTLVIAAI